MSLPRKRKLIEVTCPDCNQVRSVRFESPAIYCLSCAGKRRWKAGLFDNRKPQTPWGAGVKVRRDGYVEIRVLPNSPFYSMVHNNGYAFEHRIRMAEHLGRCLEFKEFVHHINGVRGDNRLENLELTTPSFHKLGYHEGYKEGYRKGLEDGRAGL